MPDTLPASKQRWVELVDEQLARIAEKLPPNGSWMWRFELVEPGVAPIDTTFASLKQPPAPCRIAAMVDDVYAVQPLAASAESLASDGASVVDAASAALESFAPPSPPMLHVHAP